MKAYGGVDAKIHIFLTSALDGGDLSDSRPGRFSAGERAPGTHWIGGWVDPRAGLNDVEKRKFWPCRYLNSDPSLVQPVASRYTNYANRFGNLWYKTLPEHRPHLLAVIFGPCRYVQRQYAYLTLGHYHFPPHPSFCLFSNHYTIECYTARVKESVAK
jgi:hypothetical protein